jgi:hypothetical protein
MVSVFVFRCSECFNFMIVLAYNIGQGYVHAFNVYIPGWRSQIDMVIQFLRLGSDIALRQIILSNIRDGSLLHMYVAVRLLEAGHILTTPS